MLSYTLYRIGTKIPVRPSADYLLDRRGKGQPDGNRSVASGRTLRGCRVQSDYQTVGFYLSPVIANPLREAHAEGFGVKSDRAIHISHENSGDSFWEHVPIVCSPVGIVKSHFEKGSKSTVVRCLPRSWIRRASPATALRASSGCNSTRTPSVGHSTAAVARVGAPAWTIAKHGAVCL